jgi:hypothetical protein
LLLWVMVAKNQCGVEGCWATIAAAVGAMMRGGFAARSSTAITTQQSVHAAGRKESSPPHAVLIETVVFLHVNG